MLGYQLSNWIRQDLTHAVRGIRRSRSLATTVLITLALGLGANAAIFSVFDPLLLRSPLGVTEATHVRRLYARVERGGQRELTEGFTYPQLVALRSALGSAGQVAAYTPPNSLPLRNGENAAFATTAYVTSDYFSMLGVRPALGRCSFPQQDGMGSGTPVAVLSYQLWRRAFGGDSAVLGTRIGIGKQQYTVVGVASKDFTGVDLNAVELWLPISTAPFPNDGADPWYESQWMPSLQIIVRPSRGVVPKVIATAGTVAYRQVEPADGRVAGVSTVVTGPLLEARGPSGRSQEVSIATLLLGVSLIVLLIACANAATLLLMHTTRSRHEIAVRLGLGASHLRLGSQLLTESVVLAVGGAVVALLLAWWGGSALRAALFPAILRDRPVIDPRVIVYLLGSALLVGLAAGLVPALQVRKSDVMSTLRSGAREGALQRSSLRLALLVTQASLSVVLLTGAGLFVQSLRNVRALDIGYDADHLILATVESGDSGPRRNEVATVMSQTALRLAPSPAIRDVALSSATPMGFGYGLMKLYLPGQGSAPQLHGQPAWLQAVSPDFFKTTGMRIERGRSFVPGDVAGAMNVVIVNQTMARTFWPAEDALGKCLMLLKPTAPCYRVVGIARDARRRQIIEEPTMQYFVPLRQVQAIGFLPQVLIVRTTSNDASGVISLLRRELTQQSPGASAIHVERMAEGLEVQRRPWRLGAELFAVLGLLALATTAIGVYSVIAYTFSQRTYEIGVRMALGADSAMVVSLVLRSGLRIVSGGVVIGVILAIVLARLIASQLYGISAHDPAVLAGAAMTVVVMGIAASIIPGWRAAKVDPSMALRSEF